MSAHSAVAGWISDVTSDPHPTRLPGYHDGPFARRPELLDERMFWLGHLYSCVQNDARTLFGPDHLWAEHRDFQRRLWERADWPAFTVPLAAGHRLHVVYRTDEDERGVDYLVHHADWGEVATLARVDGHFMGPGLSWPELVAAADSRPGGPDPDARLLLLLPALGDDAVPEDAAHRLAVALSNRIGVVAPEPIATAILETQGLPGPTHWTTVDGVRTNDGGYSFRNPANHFALPADGLARVSAALAP
jgi:hypothetical protein